MNIIIGTAGHVDHGKTMLIKALTGIDTDRLQEEKKRGISIDLGFAPLYLPSGRLAGVVDVPGHERFIHNMLAGAGGIDLVLLVVDATEGVMPQTREHLDILNLLQVQKGLVVLTKTDLVEEEWLELVEEEVREELNNTFLCDAPILRTSVVTGAGIEELKQAVDELTRGIKARNISAPLRLPLDRLFIKAGFGLVITGTILAGKVKNNETVEILPPGIESRVRGIQVHGKEVELAEAGQRVAINLSGVERDQLERGAVVVTPGFFHTTRYLDVKLKLLPSSSFSLKHAAPVHFYLGTTRTVGRVSLLNRDEMKGGEEEYCQFRLEKEIVAQRGDKFIIRSYSPMVTIGGGMVLDENPTRHKRFRPQVLKHFDRMQTSNEEFLLYKLKENRWLDVKGFQQLSKLGEEETLVLLEKLQSQNQVIRKAGVIFPAEKWHEWKESLLLAIKDFHAKNPLLPGFPRARGKKHLPYNFPARAFDELLLELLQEKKIDILEDTIKLAGFTPQPQKADEEVMEKIIIILREKGFAPHSLNDVAGCIGVSEKKMDSFLQYLLYQKKLVKVSDELYLERKVYNEALRILENHFAESERLTLAHYRDLIGSSRKVAQSLLEHFDGKGYTRRLGDERVAWKLPSSQQ